MAQSSMEFEDLLSSPMARTPAFSKTRVGTLEHAREDDFAARLRQRRRTVAGTEDMPVPRAASADTPRGRAPSAPGEAVHIAAGHDATHSADRRASFHHLRHVHAEHHDAVEVRRAAAAREL